MAKAIDCYICGSRNYRVYSQKHQVVRCKMCGLYYNNPIPKKITSIEKHVTGSVRYTLDQIAKRPFFRRRAERLLDEIEQRVKPGNLLDIGCSIGTELIVAKERHWNAVGVELSKTSLEIAHGNGLQVFDKPLSELDLPQASFDVITLNHTLEHLPNVHEVLIEIYRTLKPRGILFVSVPNVNHWQRFVKGDRWAFCFNDDHFLHFSPKTLNHLLTKFNFNILSCTTSRVTDFHEPIESYPWPFRMVNNIVEFLGLGIEIFCLAQLK